MKRFGIQPLAGVVLAILAAACLGFAGTRGEHVTLYTTMKLDNGQVLRAGRYYMEVPDNTQRPTVKFIRDGQVKATVSAEVERQSSKTATTTIDSVKRGNEQEILAIHPGGWKEALVFPSVHRVHNESVTRSQG